MMSPAKRVESRHSRLSKGYMTENEFLMHVAEQGEITACVRCGLMFFEISARLAKLFRSPLGDKM